MGIPQSLKGIVKDEDIDFLAQSAMDDACRPGNPKDPTKEDIVEAYVKAAATAAQARPQPSVLPDIAQPEAAATTEAAD